MTTPLTPLIIPFIIITLVLFIGAIVLQVYLSKKDNRRLGLILQGIYLAVSALIVFIVLFNTGGTSMTTSTSDGITTTTGTSIAATLGSALLVFIICNIPTAILLAIYYALGASRKNKKEIDKMNIQDLS